MVRRSRSFRSRLVPLLAAVVACSTVAVLATVAPAEAATFSNTAALTVADATCMVGPGKANLYPSNITVSGLSGTVADVNVTLHGMTHPFEGDFEILLVGPGGGAQNLVLLSDAGTGSLSNATLTLDDQAAAQLPQNSPWSSTTAKPTDYLELVQPNNPADVYPSAPTPVNSPAPTGSATLASSFNGIAPNGTWSLYVLDDGCGDTGSIGGGWSLDITTSGGAATTTTVSASPNPSTTGQNVTFTATVTSGGSPVTTGTVAFTEGATVLAANVAVNGSGVAGFATSTLPEGNHIITATYNGTAA
ncbi:MAG: Ig-like domain-containing protein, partial [Actinomycetota bacterium]|nr:Ig-like domain-containing protein [Actinomycetota bacterium]